jgi:hypothetical protein
VCWTSGRLCRKMIHLCSLLLNKSHVKIYLRFSFDTPSYILTSPLICRKSKKNRFRFSSSYIMDFKALAPCAKRGLQRINRR